MSPIGLSALESACVSQNIVFAGLSSLSWNVKERLLSMDIRCCGGQRSQGDLVRVLMGGTGGEECSRDVTTVIGMRDFSSPRHSLGGG